MLVLQATEWALLGLAFTMIVARCYLRLYLQRKNLILADYLICLAWLSGVWQAAWDIVLAKLGWLDSALTPTEISQTTSYTNKARNYCHMKLFIAKVNLSDGICQLVLLSDNTIPEQSSHFGFPLSRLSLCPPVLPLLALCSYNFHCDILHNFYFMHGSNMCHQTQC
jgi:hypothetical protein